MITMFYVSLCGKQIMNDAENDGGAHGMGEDGNHDHEWELRADGVSPSTDLNFDQNDKIIHVSISLRSYTG